MAYKKSPLERLLYDYEPYGTSNVPTNPYDDGTLWSMPLQEEEDVNPYGVSADSFIRQDSTRKRSKALEDLMNNYNPRELEEVVDPLQASRNKMNTSTRQLQDIGEVPESPTSGIIKNPLTKLWDVADVLTLPKTIASQFLNESRRFNYTMSDNQKQMQSELNQVTSAEEKQAIYEKYKDVDMTEKVLTDEQKQVNANIGKDAFNKAVGNTLKKAVTFDKEKHNELSNNIYTMFDVAKDTRRTFTGQTEESESNLPWYGKLGNFAFDAVGGALLEGKVDVDDAGKAMSYMKNVRKGEDFTDIAKNVTKENAINVIEKAKEQIGRHDDVVKRLEDFGKKTPEELETLTKQFKADEWNAKIQQKIAQNGIQGNDYYEKILKSKLIDDIDNVKVSPKDIADYVESMTKPLNNVSVNMGKDAEYLARKTKDFLGDYDFEGVKYMGKTVLSKDTLGKLAQKNSTYYMTKAGLTLANPLALPYGALKGSTKNAIERLGKDAYDNTVLGDMAKGRDKLLENVFEKFGGRASEFKKTAIQEKRLALNTIQGVEDLRKMGVKVTSDTLRQLDEFNTLKENMKKEYGDNYEAEFENIRKVMESPVTEGVIGTNVKEGVTNEFKAKVLKEKQKFINDMWATTKKKIELEDKRTFASKVKEKVEGIGEKKVADVGLYSTHHQLRETFDKLDKLKEVVNDESFDFVKRVKDMKLPKAMANDKNLQDVGFIMKKSEYKVSEYLQNTHKLNKDEANELAFKLKAEGEGNFRALEKLGINVNDNYVSSKQIKMNDVLENDKHVDYDIKFIDKKGKEHKFNKEYENKIRERILNNNNSKIKNSFMLLEREIERIKTKIKTLPDGEEKKKAYQDLGFTMDKRDSYYNREAMNDKDIPYKDKYIVDEKIKNKQNNEKFNKEYEYEQKNKEIEKNKKRNWIDELRGNKEGKNVLDEGRNDKNRIESKELAFKLEDMSKKLGEKLSFSLKNNNTNYNNRMLAVLELGRLKTLQGGTNAKILSKAEESKLAEYINHYANTGRLAPFKNKSINELMEYVGRLNKKELWQLEQGLNELKSAKYDVFDNKEKWINIFDKNEYDEHAKNLTQQDLEDSVRGTKKVNNYVNDKNVPKEWKEYSKKAKHSYIDKVYNNTKNTASNKMFKKFIEKEILKNYDNLKKNIGFNKNDVLIKTIKDLNEDELNKAKKILDDVNLYYKNFNEVKKDSFANLFLNYDKNGKILFSKDLDYEGIKNINKQYAELENIKKAYKGDLKNMPKMNTNTQIKMYKAFKSHSYHTIQTLNKAIEGYSEEFLQQAINKLTKYTTSKEFLEIAKNKNYDEYYKVMNRLNELKSNLKNIDVIKKDVGEMLKKYEGNLRRIEYYGVKPDDIKFLNEMFGDYSKVTKRMENLENFKTKVASYISESGYDYIRKTMGTKLQDLKDEEFMEKALGNIFGDEYNFKTKNGELQFGKFVNKKSLTTIHTKNGKISFDNKLATKQIKESLDLLKGDLEGVGNVTFTKDIGFKGVKKDYDVYVDASGKKTGAILSHEVAHLLDNKDTKPVVKDFTYGISKVIKESIDAGKEKDIIKLYKDANINKANFTFNGNFLSTATDYVKALKEDGAKNWVIDRENFAELASPFIHPNEDIRNRALELLGKEAKGQVYALLANKKAKNEIFNKSKYFKPNWKRPEEQYMKKIDELSDVLFQVKNQIMHPQDIKDIENKLDTWLVEDQWEKAQDYLSTRGYDIDIEDKVGWYRTDGFKKIQKYEEDIIGKIDKTMNLSEASKAMYDFTTKTLKEIGLKEEVYKKFDEVINEYYTYLPHMLDESLKNNKKASNVFLKNFGDEGLKSDVRNMFEKKRKLQGTIDEINAMMYEDGMLDGLDVDKLLDTNLERLVYKRIKESGKTIFDKQSQNYLLETMGHKVMTGQKVAEMFDTDPIEFFRQMDALGVEPINPTKTPEFLAKLERLKKDATNPNFSFTVGETDDVMAMRYAYVEGYRRWAKELADTGRYEFVTHNKFVQKKYGKKLTNEQLAEEVNKYRRKTEDELIEIFGSEHEIALRNTLDNALTETTKLNKIDTRTLKDDEWEEILSQDTFLVPKNSSKHYNDIAKTQIRPQVDGLLNVVRKVSKLFKASSLMTTSFHMGNAFCNEIKNFVYLGYEMFNPKRNLQAMQIANGLKPNDKIKNGMTHKEVLDAYIELGGEGTDAMNQFKNTVEDKFKLLSKEDKEFSNNKVLNKLAKGADKVKAFNPFDTENFLLYRGSRAIGQQIEDQPRMLNFVFHLEQGKSLQEAFDLTNKAFYDYSDLSSFESGVLKDIIPFYTFMRKNFATQIENAVNSPKEIRMLRAMFYSGQGMQSEKERELAPEYLKNGAIPLGGQDYLRLNAPAMALGDLADPKGMISSVNPLIKSPIEALLNRNFYNDSKVSRFDDTSEKLKHVAKSIVPLLGQAENFYNARENGGVVDPTTGENYVRDNARKKIREQWLGDRVDTYDMPKAEKAYLDAYAEKLNEQYFKAITERPELKLKAEEAKRKRKEDKEREKAMEAYMKELLKNRK